MGSLSGALGAANRSLSTFASALQVVQENIANASTPGYARLRPSLAPIPVPSQSGQTGLGVEMVRVQALRDRVLDFQVLRARQAKSQVEKEVGVLSQVEPSFRLESGIGAAVDEFFGSIAELSVNPGDFNLRSEVLSAANSLAGSFRGVYSEVATQERNLDSEARSTVTRINGILRDIAELQKSRSSPDARFPNSPAETRLTQLLNDLSELISFNLIRQNDGAITLLADGGTALLIGPVDRPLTTSITNQGLAVFNDQGADITADLSGEGGALGAILQTRNATLPELRSDVNRLAGSVADLVNEQQARGVDVSGLSGPPIFEFNETSVTGTGRTPGIVGATTPVPLPSVTVDFSGGLTASITASLGSFFVAAAPPSAAAPGDTVTVSFTSADGSVDRTVTTAPLLGGETAADLAVRLNDQVALDPALAGLITFSNVGGSLKVVLSDQAGRGFTFTSSTNNTAFTTGLESGGTLGGQSAEEIAAALQAEVDADATLSAAGVRFVAVGGEVKFDADVEFDFTVTDNDPAGTGFASGLAGTGAAGGALVAPSLRVADIGPAQIAAGTGASVSGNENALALAGLGSEPQIDGVTFTEFYSQIVTKVGGLSAGAQSQLETKEQVLLTAEGLRDGFSGVDLNEEALQLVQFEEAFQATLRVIQVINQLSEEVLTLVR